MIKKYSIFLVILNMSMMNYAYCPLLDNDNELKATTCALISFRIKAEGIKAEFDTALQNSQFFTKNADESITLNEQGVAMFSQPCEEAVTKITNFRSSPKKTSEPKEWFEKLKHDFNTETSIGKIEVTEISGAFVDFVQYMNGETDKQLQSAFTDYNKTIITGEGSTTDTAASLQAAETKLIETLTSLAKYLFNISEKKLCFNDFMNEMSLFFEQNKISIDVQLDKIKSNNEQFHDYITKYRNLFVENCNFVCEFGKFLSNSQEIRDSFNKFLNQLISTIPNYTSPMRTFKEIQQDKDHNNLISFILGAIKYLQTRAILEYKNAVLKATGQKPKYVPEDVSASEEPIPLPEDVPEDVSAPEEPTIPLPEDVPEDVSASEEPIPLPKDVSEDVPEDVSATGKNENRKEPTDEHLHLGDQSDTTWYSFIVSAWDNTYNWIISTMSNIWSSIIGLFSAKEEER